MKFHKRPRYNYWSNSELVLKLQGKQKPERKKFYTVDELKESLSEMAKPAPLLERFVDTLQNICMFPGDFIYSVKIYYKNSKGNTHVLDGGLEKGEWYDLTYRIPARLFGELEKFIEQEKGLETHEWEKTLVCDENMGYDKEHEGFGKPTGQALAAMEQQELYDWWKVNKDRDFYKESQESGESILDIERKYLQEEEVMLIRLIKARSSLWT